MPDCADIDQVVHNFSHYDDGPERPRSINVVKVYGINPDVLLITRYDDICRALALDPVHLCRQSRVFNAMLNGGFAEGGYRSASQAREVDLDVPFGILKTLLDIVHMQSQPTIESPCDALNLVMAADQYDLLRPDYPGLTIRALVAPSFTPTPFETPRIIDVDTYAARIGVSVYLNDETRFRELTKTIMERTACASLAAPARIPRSSPECRLLRTGR